jgi:hypothetical protein
MKKLFILMAATVFMMCLGTGVFAEEKKGEVKAPKLDVKKERVVTRTAVVQAINLKDRVVTLKDRDGNLSDLKVDESAQNLPQLKVGDEVVAKYYESIAFKMAKPGQAPMSSTRSATRAKLGEKPGGTETNQVTVVATIMEIDPGKTFVVLKGPEGKTEKIKVAVPKNLEGRKVGDQIEITYTQALAIEVNPVKKK